MGECFHDLAIYRLIQEISYQDSCRKSDQNEDQEFHPGNFHQILCLKPYFSQSDKVPFLFKKAIIKNVIHNQDTYQPYGKIHDYILFFQGSSIRDSFCKHIIDLHF